MHTDSIVSATATGTARPTGPIGVYLLDDHELVRRGLHDLISRTPDLAVVGEAGLVCDALREIPALRPDVLWTDICALEDLTPGWIQKVRTFAEPFDKRGRALRRDRGMDGARGGGLKRRIRVSS